VSDDFLSLLSAVPDALAWSQSEAGLRAELEHGPEGLIAAYHSAHRVAIPAFDRVGLPVAAPQEHLLDALAGDEDLALGARTVGGSSHGYVASLAHAPF
jgi:hypothetical protein